MRMGKRKLNKLLMTSLSVLLTGAGIACVTVRIMSSGLDPGLDIIAAEMTLPAANADYSRHTLKQHSDTGSEVSEESKNSTLSQEDTDTDNNREKTEEKSESGKESKPVSGEIVSGEFEASEPEEEEIEEYISEHEGEEQYPVYEFTATQGNTSYKNIQVKNTASTDIDIKAELEGELGFSIEKTEEPQVLIYHTHTTESYLLYDTGYFYESFYPRTTDESENVCAVGEEIAKQLNNAGIVTIHDTTLHDYPSYSGAYDRSLETINEYLDEYPTIKVVLDIHRDGIGSDTEKSKPVFTAEGKQAAQIMILAGYNYDDCEEFRDWEYNLRFALRLQDKASQMYPEMVRALNFSDFMYNMNVNTGSLLIEIGAESNTLEEVRYSGYLLGKVLIDVLSEAMEDTDGQEIKIRSG